MGWVVRPTVPPVSKRKALETRLELHIRLTGLQHHIGRHLWEWEPPGILHAEINHFLSRGYPEWPTDGIRMLHTELYASLKLYPHSSSHLSGSFPRDPSLFARYNFHHFYQLWSVYSTDEVHQKYLKWTFIALSKTSLRYKCFEYHPNVKCLSQCHDMRLEKKEKSLSEGNETLVGRKK